MRRWGSAKGDTAATCDSVGVGRLTGARNVPLCFGVTRIFVPVVQGQREILSPGVKPAMSRFASLLREILVPVVQGQREIPSPRVKPAMSRFAMLLREFWSIEEGML